MPYQQQSPYTNSQCIEQVDAVSGPGGPFRPRVIAKKQSKQVEACLPSVAVVWPISVSPTMTQSLVTLIDENPFVPPGLP